MSLSENINNIFKLAIHKKTAISISVLDILPCQKCMTRAHLGGTYTAVEMMERTLA